VLAKGVSGMAATAHEPKILTRSEFRELVIQRVREKFGMSLEEFLRAFRAGELDTDSAAYDLALLVGGANTPDRPDA
jgi:hypothetical protein